MSSPETQAALAAAWTAGMLRAAEICDEQTRANAQARRDRADDSLAFEFEGLGQVISECVRAEAAAARPPADYGADWTPIERGVLGLLAAEQDLSQFGILRQALRLYQMHHRRLKNGETATWSGDAQRVRDFAPPVDDDWRCDACGCRGFAEVYGSATQERRCIGCKRISAPPGQQVSGLLALAIRLHVEGVLSEGQVATAAGLDRVEIRRLSDESRR